MKDILIKPLFGFFVFSLLFASCKDPEEVVIREDKDEFTIEDQREIGAHLSTYLKRYAPGFEELDRASHREVYEYIDEILATVVNTNLVDTRNDFDWNITILKDDERYTAFAIPGGKMYIYTGLLKLISGENELFSILAHELYYVDKGSMVEAMKNEYSSLILSELEQGTESEGTIDIAETIHQLRYTEEMVATADTFVVDMICPFQYEARGLKSFIERASSMMDNIEWLNNRPRSSEAIRIIDDHALSCGEEELTFSERYEYYKNLLP